MVTYRFPVQNILYANSQFTRERLDWLFEQAFNQSDPLTGYIKFEGDDPAIYFLFFVKGAPYAAGRYAGGRPSSYTIHQLGTHLANSANNSMTMSVIQTDPLLLKCMLLFLQEEPTIKAPTSLIDLEYIVRQIGKTERHALITLNKESCFNFYFFKDGKGSVIYYADQDFECTQQMLIEEEMLLYAFQPGSRINACVFRDIVTEEADDASLIDRNGLLDILTGKGKSVDALAAPGAVTSVVQSEQHLNKRPEKLPTVVLAVESGPQKGERFTITLPCSIGRKDCDIILNDGQVSRRHAKLRLIEGKPVLEDLGSTNGTRVNGMAVTAKRLAPNDRITLGETVMRITPA